MAASKPQLHEDYTRADAVAGSSDRSFGLVFTAVFALIALWPLVRGDAPRLWALAVAGLFLLAALVAPAVLAPLNRVWFALGLLLHKVVSPLVLGFVFFVVVTPIGFLMRRSGKRPLPLELDRNAGSYWIARTPAEPAAETMKRQF